MKRENPLFSVDWNTTFWKHPNPCLNCGSNTWRKDWIFTYQTRGKRVRYTCFTCGEDFYPGGAVNEKLTEMLQEAQEDERERSYSHLAARIIALADQARNEKKESQHETRNFAGSTSAGSKSAGSEVN